MKRRKKQRNSAQPAGRMRQPARSGKGRKKEEVMKRAVGLANPLKKRMAFAAFVMAVVMGLFMTFPAHADGGLELHTQYPGISVKPGDSLSIPVTIDNLTGGSANVDISLSSLPEGWDGYLQGDTYEVSQVYADSGEDAAQLTLRLTVPDELSEGTYYVQVAASSGAASDRLDIALTASEAQAGRGSFTSEYPSQEGSSGTDFSFSTTLINNDLKTQNYSLSANAPSGWKVSFTPSGESTTVAGIDVESGASQGITVDVTTPDQVEAGEYTISVSAVSAEETLSQDLTVNITGTYGISVSTPDGRLSFDAHAGQESDVTLSVTNTGNVDLENVSVNCSAPSGWTVTYDLENNTIESIAAGSTTEVIAHVEPSSDAITGDYAATFTARTDETSDSAEFRVSVKTQTVWGFIAIVIILCVAGGLGYVFKKYGRR